MKHLPLAFFVLVAGCGGSSGSAAPATPESSNLEETEPAASEPKEAAEPAQPADAGETPSFSDWRDLQKMTAKPILSKGHKNTLVDIYSSADAAEIYKSQGGPYPEGARLVKVHYADESAKEIVKVPVMQKMAGGYDSEHNDWYYGVYGESGTEAKASGKIGKCINCHTSAEAGDYVFGLPEAE